MISRRAMLGIGFGVLSPRAQAQSTRIAYLRAPLRYRNLPLGPIHLIRYPTLYDSWQECSRRGVGGGSTACSFNDGTIVYSDPGDLPHEMDHIRLTRAGIPNSHHEGWQ